MAFPVFDIVQDGLHEFGPCRQIEPQAARFRDKRRLACQLADKHARVIAHARRVGMLVRLRKTRDGARMQAAFVRERRRARVRMMGWQGQIACFGHILCHGRQLFEVFLADSFASHLDFQIGDDGKQVDVAYALAVAFTVPCTCVQPARTAASVFATAHPESLWQWMPNACSGNCLHVVATISSTSNGNAPPLVSHRSMESAPARLAASMHASA